ncbi:MAG: hypothetical protein IH827_09695 [Myxococcales bacterium]|nr:hypothetical protein [Myxococcales bacterium]
MKAKGFLFGAAVVLALSAPSRADIIFDDTSGIGLETTGTTFMNALAQLERYRIIGRDPEESGKQVPFERGEAFEDLAALKERLAFALTAR